MFGELPHSKSSWNVWAQVAGQPKNSLDTAKGILDSLAHFNQCQSPTRLSGLDWLGQRFENSPGLAEEVLNHSDFKEFRTPFGETPGPRLLARVVFRLLESGQRERADQALDVLARLDTAQGSTALDRFRKMGGWWPRGADFRAVFRQVVTHCASHHRLLFPTASEGRGVGQLVWAEVAVCDAQPQVGLSAPGLHLAPWTFFLPVDHPTGNFCWGECRKHLLTALESRVGRRSLVYLLSLQPLGPEDFRGKPLHRHAAASALTPSAWTLVGPSLGLAVALGAWSAAEREHIRSLIATGAIRPDGSIEGVRFARQKVSAVHWFWKAAGVDWPFVYPKENVSQGKDDHNFARALAEFESETGQQSLHPVQRLEEITADRRFLTDGFAGYRAALQQSLAARPDASAQPAEINCTVDTWRARFGWTEEPVSGCGGTARRVGRDRRAGRRGGPEMPGKPGANAASARANLPGRQGPGVPQRLPGPVAQGPAGGRAVPRRQEGQRGQRQPAATQSPARTRRSGPRLRGRSSGPCGGSCAETRTG